MGKKEMRVSQIMKLLSERGGSMMVRHLAQHLNVSEMTIRRDLDAMQADGLLERVHGKAQLNGLVSGEFENIENDYALISEIQKNLDKKTRIGKFAASLIEENDVIILDNGSTTDQVAINIDGEKQLTVACFNLNIVEHLFRHKKIDLLLGGGFLHRSDKMFESAEGVSYLKGVRANKVFISASGVHEKLGLTCAHHYEVLGKQAIIETALKRILLVDSSKFGTIKTIYFAPLNDIDIIITDNGISDDWQEIIANRGIVLHIV